MQNVTLGDGTVIRDLANQSEIGEAVRIQEETWGAGFTERVPAAILLVAQKIGGVSAGAFSPDGRLLGFVFGLTGVRDGRLVHWSDMLAVRPEAQGRHLGEALKHFQHDRCRELGVETIYWTFDPFVARNAHLNLNRLGATVEEFVPDMYGTNTNSRMHGALGTDRFIVAWPVHAEPVPMSSDRALLAGVPVVGGAAGDVTTPLTPFPAAGAVAVRIPRDYQTLLADDLERVRAWRVSARRAFLHYLPLGYRVTAFVPDPAADATYLLAAPT
jgi:predicted GNAT superfamily acetyltransferase